MACHNHCGRTQLVFCAVPLEEQTPRWPGAGLCSSCGDGGHAGCSCFLFWVPQALGFHRGPGLPGSMKRFVCITAAERPLW